MASISFEGGYSFVGVAESDGLALISIVLGSDVVMHEDESADMRNLTEARRLFEWGFSNFGMRTILSSTMPFVSVPVLHGAGADSVNLRPDSSLILLLDNGIVTDEYFEERVTIYSVENEEPLIAPIVAGEVLGEVTIVRRRDGFEFETILLVANTGIDLHPVEYIRMQISEALGSPIARNVIIILSVLVAGYIALVVRYNIIRHKRILAIREAKNKIIEERQSKSTRDDFD
jgi:D-alanyl-D-alanine carboxypeptidase